VPETRLLVLASPCLPNGLMPCIACLMPCKSLWVVGLKCSKIRSSLDPSAAAPWSALPWCSFPCPERSNPAEHLADLVAVDHASPEEEAASSERVEGLILRFQRTHPAPVGIGAAHAPAHTGQNGVPRAHGSGEGHAAQGAQAGVCGHVQAPLLPRLEAGACRYLLRHWHMRHLRVRRMEPLPEADAHAAGRMGLHETLH